MSGRNNVKEYIDMKKSKCNIKRIVALASSVLLVSSLTACGQSETYETFTFPDQPESSLVAVSDTYVENPIQFQDAGDKDECLAEFASENGACKIRKMEHYFDITLDYENFTHSEIGKAYAETVLEAYPDFHESIEPYLYENIMGGFPALVDDYNPVWDRISYFMDTPGTLKDEYKEEIIAYAETLSGGVHGFEQDGHISYEEAVTFSFVPDALRGTACSALSLWGSKTETGDPITLRLLDWHLGTENQMCKMHAIIHAKNGEKTYTGISFIGFGFIVSAINNDGVFAAILDVGSDEMYEFEGRKSYTYDLRYALEEYTTAKELGDYMVGNSADYTWSHNLIITDKKDSFCAEDAVLQAQEKGTAKSVLRDSSTPLLKNLSWDSPDSLCVVNTFATEGNDDKMYFDANFVRFEKYNEWVAAEDAFTVGEIKTMISREKVNQGQEIGEAVVQNVRNRGTAQMIIIDYHTGNIQVSFTPETGPSDDVVFTDVGSY